MPQRGCPPGCETIVVFAGTLVVQGHGLAQVSRPAARTEMGTIGQSLAALGLEPRALQAETRRLVRVFSGIALRAVRVAGGIRLRSRAATGSQALLAGITLAMAMLPEEFPVVLTVFLALGAWRSRARSVLTRRVRGDRDAGLGDRAVRGQDRHADATTA